MNGSGLKEFGYAVCHLVGIPIELMDLPTLCDIFGAKKAVIVFPL